jgi:hypothetical protein
MSNLEHNIANLRERIGIALKKSPHQHDSVLLLAVSKTRSAAEIRRAYACGLKDYGENYLQEAADKINCLGDLDINWHFIGALQSNKTRAVAELFDWVHTLDRLKVARRLNAQRPAHKAPLNCCIQVNIDNEASKAGVSIEECSLLADQLSQLPNLRLRGLMAIPSADNTQHKQRQNFASMTALLRQLQLTHPQLDTLSMGMSADFELAIEEGATIIRIGTALFGQRQS